MKLMSAMVVAGLAVGAGLPGAIAAEPQDKVTLTGCAVKGNGDGDGFLLANRMAPASPDMKSSRMLYWLDDDDDVVEKFMGQLVEITGEIEGDVKRGEIEVERENGLIELEIKADGKKANVKLPEVPSAVGTSGSVKDREVELPYLVRKLDVKSVKSIAPTCQ